MIIRKRFRADILIDWFREGISRGSYIRDFYLLPTIKYHNGDGIYKELEICWLKYFISFVW